LTTRLGENYRPGGKNRNGALTKKCGPGNWVTGCRDLPIYLNRELIAEKRLNAGEVDRTAAAARRRLGYHGG
jgi:hypothetical protein